MKLTDDEKAMLDGRDGPARQKAMDLLVCYGEALGAERLVDTNNVVGTMVATNPFIREFAAKYGSLNDPGGVLMSDTCPCLGQIMPKGTRVVATDSAKQAHYLPSILGVQTWFGSVEDCIKAALSDQWGGELE